MSTQDDRYAALLDAWLDGALTAEESAQVEALLAESPALLSYVEDALAIRAAFPAAEETEVDAGFSARVLARIEAQVPPSRAEGSAAPSVAPPKAPRRSRYRAALLPLAACLAFAVLAGGIGVLRSGGKGASDVVAAPAAAAPAGSGSGVISGGPAAAQGGQEKEVPATAAEAEESVSQQSANDAAAPMPEPAAVFPDAEEDDGYAAVCVIPMSRAEGLLDDMTPVSESERELRYEIPSELFSLWLEQGALEDMGAQIDPAGPAEEGTVLIVIRK